MVSRMWMKLEGRKFFSRLFSHQWITWEWESELWGAKKWLQIKACIISRCCFCPSSKVLGCIASHNFSILFHFFSTFFSQWFSIYLSLSILLSLSSLLAIYLSPSSPTFYSCVLWIVCYVRFSFSLALLPSLLFCFSLSLAICLSSLTFFFWSSFMILQDTSKLGM